MLAFWELAYLAQNSAVRRRAIYTDVNRKPANIFEQILSQSLSVLGEVDLKLAEVRNPPTPTAVILATPSNTAASAIPSPPPIPISQINPLLTSPVSSTHKFLEGVQSKDGSTPTLQHVIEKLPYQPPSIAEVEANATKSFKSKMEPFLSSPWGSMFRQSIHATTSQLIPNVGLQVNAVQAISRLVTSSLAEDEYGIVQNHAPTLLASFISTMDTLDKYLASPPISWTDVESIQKQEKGELHLVEPQLLLSALKEGFKDIATAYAPYIDGMGLASDTRKIILEARERGLP
ncbi:nucleoporin protein Ndc1-Nup [Tuber brumale]|nr:nucleoporin protein Ndc1-Nup [Tuber brumale]